MFDVDGRANSVCAHLTASSPVESYAAWTPGSLLLLPDWIHRILFVFSVLVLPGSSVALVCYSVKGGKVTKSEPETLLLGSHLAY